RRRAVRRGPADVVELRGAQRRGDHPGPRGLGGRALPRGTWLPRIPARRAAAARRPAETTLMEQARWPVRPQGTSLAGDRLVGGRDQRGGVGEDPLLRSEQAGRGRGQRDGLRRPRVARWRAGEPEGGGEVAAGAAAEGADIRLADTEPPLDDT